MNKIINKIFIFGIVTSGFFLGCSEEELDATSIFVDSEITLNELDSYISTEFTTPYNIAILYKYVDMESNMNYNLSPASYEASIRTTRLIQYLAIEPYNDVTGSTEFIANYFPKILNYVGSPAYNNNGTVLLGTAEGGRKITMFDLNRLPQNAGNVDYLVDRYFHTIHHEFAHIFHQTKPFTPAFNQISGTRYVQDLWNTEYPATPAGRAAALQTGFISPYASKDPNEDFVEILSFYITLTPTVWNERMTIAGTSGSPLIEQKLEIIRSYMQDSWGIDIDVLRDNILDRLENFSSFDQTNIQ
ncbi:zinc-binding metallopeptidase [Sphingobacterium haloxyli]|uniref:Substrate import-associated zinc metallohydrolase lipoprotein n=1 Tax=Sphingobacterium haloxyli TaxID=2100533 RepID=A0A2S9J8U4_9SPHI|nr:putative zinc-binding metallopeptidase [Sphingobacterium haloxyli]PRD49191.1 hypothetical protein C5745_00695 [Sphingobacterium haloxyli]